jgi:hypothetical protein
MCPSIAGGTAPARTGATRLESGLSVTIHWRTRPALEDPAVKMAHELAQSLGVAARSAKKAVELRRPVQIDRGSVVVAELWEAAGTA